MKIQIKKRFTAAVLFETEVDDSDKHPMRTALARAIRAGRDPEALRAERNEIHAQMADHDEWDDQCKETQEARKSELDAIERELANPFAGADLAGANLAGADLAHAYLAGADLARADLAGADLARANLAGANLAGADLADADLARAYLAGADLADADLARAYLAGADLAHANLARADLARAYLAGADLAHANLARADLARADLAGADLAHANLARADLARADLAGADLARADLAGADLADADLAGANLAGADLAGANLAGADLADANLARAYLADADLAGANLAGADLADAYLARADLARARSLPIGVTATDPPTPYVRAATDEEHAKLEREHMLRYRERHPNVPIVEALDRRILEAITADGCRLEMDSWHGGESENGTACGTTHCRGGWAVHLAGPRGYELEKEFGVQNAAAMIYRASTGRVPHFFATNERALEDIKRRAEAAAP